MALKIHGTPKDGRLMLNRAQAELKGRWLAEREGKPVSVEFKCHAASKTYSQVKTHFGLSVMMIHQAMNDQGWDIFGITPNRPMVHEILTQCCGGVGEGGAIVRLSEMSVREAMQFFENICDWGSKQLGIVILHPNPNWKEDKEIT